MSLISIQRLLPPDVGAAITQHDLINAGPTEHSRERVETITRNLTPPEGKKSWRPNPHDVAALRIWKTKLAAAERRDKIVAERRARGPEYRDCWCLGVGGKLESVIAIPSPYGEGSIAATREDAPVAYSWYCSCPDGVVARERVETYREKLTDEVMRARALRIVGNSGLPPAYHGLTVASWREGTLRAGASPMAVEEVICAIENWREDVSHQGRAPKTLVLAGRYGGGKTTLAAALAQEKLDAGWSVLFRSTPDMFAQVREGERYDTEGASEGEIVDTLMSVRLLVIDDLGAECLDTGKQARVRDVLFRILDHRASWLLPTILTTNLTAAGLKDAVTPRVTNRILPASVSRVVALKEESFPDLREQSW